MPTLPPEVLALLARFAPLFSTRTWAYVPALVVGASWHRGGARSALCCGPWA